MKGIVLGLLVLLGVAVLGVEVKEVTRTASAFVVHPDGYLVTSVSLLSGAEKITVTLEGRTMTASVLAEDYARDLMLLQVPAKGLTSLPLVNSNTVQLGEEVRVFGFPGADVKITRGSVAGITTLRTMKAFQLDPAVPVGNLGGPVVTETGGVLGMVSLDIDKQDAKETGLVVPINYARQLLRNEFIDLPPAENLPKLSGPELAKRVAPAVAQVTATCIDYANMGEDYVPDVLKARAFNLVDAKGNVVASLAMSEGNVTLNLLSPGSKAMLGLWAMPDGRTVLGMRDEKGKDRVSVWCGGEQTEFSINDPDGYVRLMMGLSYKDWKAGNSYVILGDQDGVLSQGMSLDSRGAMLYLAKEKQQFLRLFVNPDRTPTFEIGNAKGKIEVLLPSKR